MISKSENIKLKEAQHSLEKDKNQYSDLEPEKLMQDSVFQSTDEINFDLKSAIGLIITKKQSKGTGILLTSKIVLTSFHNITYTKDKKIHLAKPKEILFYQGLSGFFDNIKSVKVKSYKYPSQSFQKFKKLADQSILQNTKDDYVLLELKEDAVLPFQEKKIVLVQNFQDHGFKFQKEIFFYYAKDIHREDFIFRNQATLIGYPNASGKEIFRKMSKGNLHKILQYDQISHSCSTEKGNSGSPIILKSKDDSDQISYIVGIHTASSNESNKNVGKCINSEMISLIEDFKLKVHSSFFTKTIWFFKSNIAKLCKFLRGQQHQNSTMNESYSSAPVTLDYLEPISQKNSKQNQK